MSKGTLDRLSVRYFQTAVQDLKIEEGANGSQIIRAMSVFRTGTFKDSWGDPHTWEAEHLEQMVFNFNLLRNRGTLPNVPVRDGHPGLFGSGGAVVGYVEDLYTINGAAYADGQTRLVADLDITEPEAFGKIERGTWRGRSAEIGFYETNDEVMYWPVFMGLAWVDIPAVEGLFSKNASNGDSKFTFIRDDQEGAVAGAKKTTSTHTAPPAAPAAEPAGTPATAPTPPEGAEGGSEEEEEGAGTAPPAAPATPPAAPPAAPHAHPSAPTYTFQINGQPVTDFGKVQQHIISLETAISEQADANRREFVTSLANRNLIPATQVEQMQKHALSLNDEQWADFQKLYPEDAEPSGLFQNHGTNRSESNPTGGEGPSEEDTLRETVTMHRKSGMPEAKVLETPSYKRLMEITGGKG